jgi:purine-binding chemotaxis protein CheW
LLIIRELSMENTMIKDTPLHLVTFRLGAQVYALPIEPIQQVIEMVTITPVPQVRASVEGVINFHGATVPVVNLREHLGMPKIPLKLHTPIVMAFVSGRLVGLIVDEVLAVLDLPSTQMVIPQDILPEGLGKTSLLRGLFHANGDTILVLDIEHLFAPQEATALAEAVATLADEIEPTDKVSVKPSVKPALKLKPTPQEKSRPKGKKKRETGKVPEEKVVSPAGSVESLA